MPTKFADRYAPDEWRKLYHLDESTGMFFWKPREKGLVFGEWCAADKYIATFNRIRAGSRADSLSPSGYRVLQPFCIKMMAHRLVWGFVTGAWPEGEVDHINGIREDNRFDNLRIVDRSGNATNTAVRSDNMSGRVGVHFDVARGRWRAQIQKHGNIRHLGRFDTFDEAVAARCAAEPDLGFHPNHGRNPTWTR